MTGTKFQLGAVLVVVAISAVALGIRGDESQTPSAAQAEAGSVSGVRRYDPLEGKTVQQLEDERLGRCSAEKLFEPSGIIGTTQIVYFVSCRTNKLPLSFTLKAANFDGGKYVESARFAGATAVKSGRRYGVDLSCGFMGGSIDCAIPSRAIKRTPKASHMWKVSFTGILEVEFDPCERRILAGMGVPGPRLSLAGFQSALPPVKGCRD